MAISYQNREDLAHTPAIGVSENSSLEEQSVDDQNQFLKIVKNKNLSPRLKKLKKRLLIKSPFQKKNSQSKTA